MGAHSARIRHNPGTIPFPARSRDDINRLLMNAKGCHMARKEPPRLTVRLGRDGQLWAIWGRIGDQEIWLAGLLTEESRALYLSWHPEWKVEGQ